MARLEAKVNPGVRAAVSMQLAFAAPMGEEAP
jgi:hypothetical protein